MGCYNQMGRYCSAPIYMVCVLYVCCNITSVRLVIPIDYYHGVANYDNNKLVLADITVYSIGYLYFLQDKCTQWNILH